MRQKASGTVRLTEEAGHLEGAGSVLAFAKLDSKHDTAPSGTPSKLAAHPVKRVGKVTGSHVPEGAARLSLRPQRVAQAAQCEHRVQGGHHGTQAAEAAGATCPTDRLGLQTRPYIGRGAYAKWSQGVGTTCSLAGFAMCT